MKGKFQHRKHADGMRRAARLFPNEAKKKRRTIDISRNRIFPRCALQNIKGQIGELPDAKKGRFVRVYGLPEKDAAILTDTRELADYFEACVKIGRIPAQKLANWIINKKVNIDDVLPAALILSILKAQEVVDVPPDLIAKVLADNPKAMSDYKAGKQQSLMFLMGTVKRQLPKGDVKIILDMLKKELDTH